MSDLVDDAMAELYAADPDQFTQRRTELAARARAAGEPAAARQIAGLRKPTRSAWVVNRLVRADPDAASRLRALAAELRDAEGSADGGRIRELTAARSRLVDELTRQALAESGNPSPLAPRRGRGGLGGKAAVPRGVRGDGSPREEQQGGRGGLGGTASPQEQGGPGGTGGGSPPCKGGAGDRSPRVSRALREEVTATLDAALADPQVAGGLGTLTRAARWAGFGLDAAAPAAGAPPVVPRRPVPAEREAERTRRRQEKFDEAERAVAGAVRDADAAAAAERDLEESVRRLETDLAAARQRLAAARRRSYRAVSRRQRAERELGRLRE